MNSPFKPRKEVNRIAGDFPETFQITLDENAQREMAKAATLMGLRPSKYMTNLLCGVTSLIVAVYKAGGMTALNELAESLCMVESKTPPAAADQAAAEKGGDHV